MRCLIREKFKRVIDFNGQLINKVNGNYHKLTEEEIKFYNKLIYSNLKVLNNIANNMISKQTLIEEWSIKASEILESQMILCNL